jgi:protein disulfide-isomerase A6
LPTQVLLFTDKNASTVLYKGLSWSYAWRLAFGEVRSSEETAALLEQYGVAKMPTLLAVKVGQLLW